MESSIRKNYKSSEKSKLQSKIQTAYICQHGRTDELSDRMYSRNIASKQLPPKYFSRPVSNRRTVMPTIDSRKKSTVVKGKFEKYDMTRDFSPGVGGPYNGYSDNVDKESVLLNRFNVLQKCTQVSFIPGSGSDLYNDTLPETNSVEQPFSLLQSNQVFDNFNPNECGLAKETFFNHTRQQSKDVKL